MHCGIDVVAGWRVCRCPVPALFPAVERRLGIRIDGWGWKGMEEPR